MQHDKPNNVMSDFGGTARLLQTVPLEQVIAMYRKKCGADIESFFNGHDNIYLYECTRTGYRFWYPQSFAGNEEFYQLLEKSWPEYYRTTRWEYPIARKVITGARNVLEVGCGRGYFLRTLEEMEVDAIGLELNSRAISEKVTRYPIYPDTVESLIKTEKTRFQAICVFQVLEHISEPHNFLKSLIQLLEPDGILLLSTPNRENVTLASQQDAFDFPPHHIGQFSSETFVKISDVLGLKAERIYIEPRRHVPESVTMKTGSNYLFKCARLIARTAYNAGYSISHEPGQNLLAVLRKS
jgi:SAM-dependent methyltransferase